MPHCLIEYSKDLEAQLLPEDLMKTVYHAAIDSGLFEAKDIKVRLLSFSKFLPIDGKTAFIHVTLRLLSGRHVETRRALSQQVFDRIQALGLRGLAMTVDIVEIARETYTKN